MRISYRIKSEELERISNIYQECNDNLKVKKYIITFYIYSKSINNYIYN